MKEHFTYEQIIRSLWLFKALIGPLVVNVVAYVKRIV